MTIELNHISKSFGSKKVLDDVSVIFRDGQIHALLGENGAGKSTIARILTGALIPDSGSLLISTQESATDGIADKGSAPQTVSMQTVSFKNEGESSRAGVIQVHQTPLLAGSLSVMQNIMLGADKTAKQKIVNLIAEWCPSLNMRSLVRDTGGDERFYTSLISALCRNPRVLILDEPGALLDWEQRRSLYAHIRQLAQQGMNIIVITHSMSEAELYTDTVTVLIQGKVAAQYENSKDFDRNKFSFSEEMKAGDDCRHSRIVPEKDSASISFAHITCRPRTRPALFDISFSFSAGSITVINGIQESGLGTLENIITGMETELVQGTCSITVPGKKKITLDLRRHPLTAQFLRRPNTSQSITGIVPSNRTLRGSNPSLTVCQLLSAQYTGSDPYTFAQKIISLTNVNTTPDDSTSSLSGGMLQRLIFTRELSTPPVFAILCEPLQGLDSLSAQHTCARIKTLALSGTAVLILSASGFPEEYADTAFTLESGTLVKKEPHNEN